MTHSLVQISWLHVAICHMHTHTIHNTNTPRLARRLGLVGEMSHGPQHASRRHTTPFAPPPHGHNHPFPPAQTPLIHPRPCRRRRVELPERFDAPLPAHLSHFQPLLDASPHLTEALQRVSTIAQALALQPRPGSRLCPASAQAPPLVVANTHLFFHSNAAHIRTMHVDTIVMEAFELAAECGRSGATDDGATPAVIFCGDLNSDLNDGVPGTVELLRSGRLPATHWDWEAGAHFSFGNGRGEQAAPGDDADGGTAARDGAVAVPPVEVTGVDLQLPSSFRSTHALEMDTVSNYVPGYKGLLDYIWCEEGRVRPVHAFPLPTPTQLRAYVPDGVNPSDHLPVMADVELVAAGGEGGAAGAGAEEGIGSRSGDAAAGSCAAVPGTTPSAEDRPSLAAGNVHPATAASVPVAVAALHAGGVVAVPTDTLYGLAALGHCDGGIDRIYEIKGRAANVPLAVCVASVADVAVCGDCSAVPPGLLAALLPGPVTVVVARRADAPLSPQLNPGMSGIAVRVPDSGFVRDVVCGAGAPVVLTSANRSGTPSTVEVAEFEELWGEVDAVFDGGRIDGDRAGSTIVDLQPAGGGVYRILRDGSAREQTEGTLRRYGLALAQPAVA